MANGDFGSGRGNIVTDAARFLWGLFGGGIDKNVKRALEGLRDSFSDMADALAEFFGDVAMVLATVWSFSRKLWDRVLLPVLQKLDTWITRVFAWLKDTFGPIIEALLWLRKKILDFYAKWLAPIFDTLDVLRRILGIFSLFGLEWSKRLDRALAEIQGKLEAGIARVVGEINRVIGVVDRIVTLDGLLQRVTLLRTMIRDVTAVWNIVYNADAPTVTEADRARIRSGGDARPAAVVVTETKAFLRTGQGPLAPHVAVGVDTAVRYMRVGR